MDLLCILYTFFAKQHQVMSYHNVPILNA